MTPSITCPVQRYGYTGINKRGVLLDSSEIDCAELLNGEIDSLGLLGFLSFQYFPFDRTLFDAIKRFYITGLTKPSKSLSEYFSEFCSLGNVTLMGKVPSPEIINSLIRDEITEAVSGNKRIAVLLSGGLDSRIILGNLLKLRNDGEINRDRIHIVSWGQSNCRDVFLAEQVATAFGLEFTRFELDSTCIKRNIDFAADNSILDVSPVHFHMAPQIGKVFSPRDTCVLVGTFGNNQIEGEFLWRHLSEAPELHLDDWLSVLLPNVASTIKQRATSEFQDVASSLISPGLTPLTQKSFELETSYVQNMLNRAFDCLRLQGFDVAQCFTSNELTRYLRQLSVRGRSNELRKSCLLDISAAFPKLERTALYSFDCPKGKLHRSLHQYGRWTAENVEVIVDGLQQLTPSLQSLLNVKRLLQLARSLASQGPQSNEIAYVLNYICSLGYSSRNSAIRSHWAFPIEAQDHPAVRLRPDAFASRPHRLNA